MHGKGWIASLVLVVAASAAVFGWVELTSEHKHQLPYRALILPIIGHFLAAPSLILFSATLAFVYPPLMPSNAIEWNSPYPRLHGVLTGLGERILFAPVAVALFREPTALVAVVAAYVALRAFRVELGDKTPGEKRLSLQSVWQLVFNISFPILAAWFFWNAAEIAEFTKDIKWAAPSLSVCDLCSE